MYNFYACDLLTEIGQFFMTQMDLEKIIGLDLITHWLISMPVAVQDCS